MAQPRRAHAGAAHDGEVEQLAHGSQSDSVVFHDWRHTFATIALNYRLIDVVTLSKILGHRNASTTLDVYATGLEDSMRRGMESYESLGVASE